MSVEMKLGRWQARDGTVHVIDQYDGFWTESSNGHWWNNKGWFYGKDDEDGDLWDLILYLGPIELSPTPACEDQAGTPVVSTVSTETAGEQLQRMRERYNAMDREASIYSGLLAALDQAKGDLGEHIRAIEKEHDL